MAQETVKLLIPFEALADSVKELSLEDKRRLWELLDEQIAQDEERAWEHDPTVRAEIREARAAFKAGDYMSIDEYVQSDPSIMMGKPVIAGTRITVELILEKLAAGETVEQILEAHPRLKREAIQAALAFAPEALRADVIYPLGERKSNDAF